MSPRWQRLVTSPCECRWSVAGYRSVTERPGFKYTRAPSRGGSSIAVTSLEAYDSINATILPYWAFHEWAGIQHNFITTNSWHGSTTVEVLSPIIDSYYKINHLFFAVSRHKQGSWVPPLSPVLHTELTYPGERGGTAVGHSSFGGVVYISGEDFEELKRNLSTVMVQRRPVGSDLRFEANMGIAELHLNACSRTDGGAPNE